MVSLGGLDVAYGSQLQLTRTNVLCVASDGTATQAEADVVHSIAAQKFPVSLRPDYTCLLGNDFANGYATALTDQVENNILKDVTAVPLSGSHYEAPSGTGATAAGSRGLAIEAILNVGVLTTLGGTEAAADLFTEADSPADGLTASSEMLTGAQMFSEVMLTAWQTGDDTTQGARVDTVNLTNALTNAGFGSVTELGDFAGSLTDTTSLADLETALNGKAYLVSVVALGAIY